jgi:hypothetical protein
MGARASGAIFISYRREDTAYPAGWLFDRLADTYGEHLIFKDVDSIALGDDFVDVITRAVASTDVLLALIGEKWIAVTDEGGTRRLDDPDDFVRLEIEAALTRGIRVIPILVGGTTMPRSDQLPPGLTTLARRNALELSPSRFESDTGRLIKVLDKTLAEVREETLAGSLKANQEIAATRPFDESTSSTRPPSRTEPSFPEQRGPAQVSDKSGGRTGGDVPPKTSWYDPFVRHWRLLAGIGSVSLLVLAVIVVVSNRSGSPSDASTDVSTPPTRVDQDLISASSSSIHEPEHVDTTTYTYWPSNTLDGERVTAWNAEDEGVGESLTYKFDRPVRLVRLDIINGYAEDFPTFEKNARLRAVTFITDHRSIQRQLKDLMRWQTVDGSFGVTTTLTIRIDSVYVGTDYNDAALSEIRFWEATT